MAKYLQLPDGNSLKVPDNMSYEEAMSLAQTKFPDLFSTAPKQDTSGLKAAASAGASRLKGQAALTAAKLGVMDVAEAEKYQKEKEAEAAARFTPTEKGWTEDFGLKFRETLGGSLPYMAAPAAAGLAALALPVSAPVAAGAGLLGAGAVSTGQFTGSNLAAQMDTGKTLEQASLGKAAAAAVPQALIDTAAMALLPGVGKLFGSVGSKLTTEQAKAIASQTLGKAAADYAAKTGTAMGREGVTEVAQQTLERLQAGLNIADEDARKEYIESFIGGAVLGGTLAPAGRYIERSGAQAQAAKAEREERSVLAQQAAEQQRAAKQEEEAQRQTPEHALRVGQEYDTLLAEFQSRKAALKTPGKDATPVEKAEYADAQKALKELNAQLKDIVPEYRRTAPIRARAEQEQAAAAEQARTAGMSPMEYMLDQTSEVVDTPYTPAEPDLAGYEMPEPVVRKYAAPPAAYAQERVQLAQDQAVEPDAATYTSYLMQDVGMARAVLDDADVVLPKGVRKELAKAVPAQEAALRLQDAAARKQSTAASQQRLASVEEEEQAALDAQRAQAERDAEESNLAPGVGSEIMALRRIAANPTGDVKDEGVLSTKVDRLVDVLLSGGPAPAGRVVAGAATTDTSSADMLRAQLAYALATENKPRANELKKQLADLNEPDTERSAGDLEFGEAAKEAGVEGRLSQDAMKANRVTRLSNTQLSAFDRLTDFVQRVREGNQEVSDARKQTLRNAAEKLKDTVAGLALNEIDARRTQAGLPELGVAEKTKLVGRVSQTLNELIERGAGIFQKPVERKAQMRGSKIVLGADEDVKQPKGRRVFNNYEAAAKALRDQMRSDIDAIGGFAPAEVATPRPERKAQRVVPLLKPQRPGFSDRDVGQQFVAAYDRAKSDADYRTLKDVESKFGKLSEAAQDEALVQVRRVENNMPLEIRGTLKDELADLRAAGVSDTGQAELFAGDTEKASTRTTPQRFLAFLDSKKVQGLRAKLAEENRVLAFQEKRAATIAKKVADETAKAEAAAQKILASNARTPAQKARDALDRLVGPESKVTQALQIAESVRAPREAARARIRVMLSQIEDAERRAKKQVADIQELVNYTNSKLTELATKSGSGVEPSMNDLAMWTQARDNQLSEIKKAQKVLDAVQKSLKAAQATQARVIEDHASDTIGNALIKEGEKAQRKYDAAKTALEKAETEEREALRVVKAEQKKPAPVAKTTEEQVLERLGPDARVESVERVYRDTSDANVQAQVNAERKNIAAAEEAHDVAKAAGNKLAMENALRRIETAYDKMYNILNNAPLRRDTEKFASHVEAFDRAQTKTMEATARLFEEQAGIKPLKMTERRTIASVRNVRSNRIVPQFKEESVAAQETRVKQEEATGVYPAKALEELAKARAARAEVQRQIDYIDANPAAPRSEAKKRQTDARTAAVAKRKTLDEQIKALGAAQKEVVAEAKLDTQAEKALRRERTRMVRSAGRLQEAVGEDVADPDLLFSRGTPVNGLTGTELRSELRRAVGDEDTYAKKVSVFDSVQDFLRTHKQYAGKIPTDAKGFVDPDTGRAYLFAENIAKGEGMGILLHEVGVHLGFRNFFNAGQFNAIAKAVRNWANAPANTLEGKIGRAAAKRAKDAGTSAAQMDDELIAYAVEEAVKAGVEPAGVKGGSAVQNWLRMIVNAFNKALETLGLAPEKLKVGDLVNMAYGAAQLELKGTWHGTAGNFTEFDHSYMNSGEGSQAFGWGTYRAERESIAQYYQRVAEDKNSGRTLDVVNAWYDLPEIKKWNAEGINKPIYKGMTFDEAVANWKKDKKANADVGAAIGVFENYHTEPYYKTEAAFHKAMGDLLDQVRDNTRAAIQRAPTPEIKERQQQALSALERVDAKDFDYRADLPPTLLPEPPKGRLLRTLHGQPEEAFINLDAPMLDQSARVGDALRKVFESLTNGQKARFNRELSGDPNPSGKDVYDAFKLAMGNQKDVSDLMASFGIAGNKFLDRPSRSQPVSDKSRYNYVDFLDKDQGAAIVAADIDPVGPASGLLFSRGAPAPANAIEALSRDIVAQPKTLKQKLGDSAALQAEMQAVDMRAGLRDVLKAGAAEMGDDTKFTQAMYNVLKADQKMPVAYTVMSMGPLELYKDAKGFYGVRSTNKHSAKDVFDAIADMPGTDTQSKIDVATTYMIAQRAANKGLSKLDLGELGVTQEKLDAAMAAVEADPALEKSLEAVRRAYNAYNKGQIRFLAASGAIPKQVAEKLLAGGDYVPYYRVKDNGMAELNFGNNTMISIGDIRRQPYLASLKGGETKILPLNESLPLNTFLLTDMALTNMATKNVAYALQAMGKKSDVMQIHSGTGPADPGVIRFKQEPDPNNEKDTGERWLKVETKGTAAEGVPAELLVQSLEGSHLALPEFLKLGGVAADLLRSGVTRTPLYIARQLIRDPMAAAFTGGLNYNAFTAVLKAGKEFVRMNRGTSDAQMKLLEKGLVQSGIFAGDTSDMKKMALQIASGKDQSVMDKVFAAADRAALRADAATRSLVYENAEANGLSDVEADMMTMESMNFYKRGLSPTLQYASRLIPFFNAQIQGLNVLFKAARGNMPFEEQQQIKRKFFNNAMLLVATGLVYAMAMEDDETFRNARPRDKYTNFFLPIPGLDEPIKLPIPFEAGYFYSLAVAAVDGMRAETDSKEQWQAIKDLFLNSIPGYSSMGIPQIVKPAFEVWTNKNFMSGTAVESRRFQGMDPEERYNANTTELAKAMSKALPILSPIQIEHLVRGYLGVLPLAAAGAANGLFAREGKGEAPEKRLSEMPVLGPAFQKKYGGGDRDVAYEMAKEAMDAKTTLNKIMAEGRREDAVAYRDENHARLAVASAAGQYRQLVGRINADLRRTQERNDLSAAEKRVRIDNLEKAADEAAKRFTQRVRQVRDQ